jgi:hypothetical protein
VSARIIQGNVFDVLPTLKRGSVDCVVTSVPYWMLRSYLPKDHPLKSFELGSEPTPAAYVASMVKVFSLVRDVMAEHAVCFLNVGDTYAYDGKWGGATSGKHRSELHRKNGLPREQRGAGTGLGDGSLCLIPQRLAIALQEPWEVDPCVKDKHDRAWLAAIFDGEGCIGIRRQSRAEDRERGWNDGFVVYTSVGMNDRCVLDHCVEITGLGKITIKNRADTTDGRGIRSRFDTFGWRLDGIQATDIVRAIFPYLIAKKKQAMIAYTLDGLNKARSGRAAPVPAEIQEKKKYLWELIKRANQREAIDLPDWIEEPKPRLEPGWIVRSVIVWHKPAPMPSSVSGWAYRRCRVKIGASEQNHHLRPGTGRSNTNVPGAHASRSTPNTTAEWQDCPGCDKCTPHGGYRLRRGSWRPTSSWEPVLMLAKSSRYFADGEPVRQPSAAATVSRNEYTRVIDDPDEQFAVKHDHETTAAGANPRDVWTIAAEPLREKHYAAYPSELVYRCLAAGTSAKGYCPACGAPWVRVVESEDTGLRQKKGDNWDTGSGGHGKFHRNGREEGESDQPVMSAKTVGWKQSCSCSPREPRPGLVLDPFSGSGRTGIEALRMGLDFIGIDLNEEYCMMSRRLLREESPLFAGA